jgi:hypothetical protein
MNTEYLPENFTGNTVTIPESIYNSFISLSTDYFDMENKIKNFKQDRIYQSGVDCPMCGEHIQTYKRQFNISYVFFLICLVRLKKENKNGKVHYQEVINRCHNDYSRNVSDWPIIRKFDLISSIDGYIELTTHGKQFLKNLETVPTWKLISGNCIIKQSKDVYRFSDFQDQIKI